MRHLLSHKDIEVNNSGKGSCTPIVAACANGHKDVIQQLLARPDTDVNRANKSGETALIYACCGCQCTRMIFYINCIPVGYRRFYNIHHNNVPDLLAHEKINVNQTDEDGISTQKKIQNLKWLNFFKTHSHASK